MDDVRDVAIVGRGIKKESAVFCLHEEHGGEDVQKRDADAGDVLGELGDAFHNGFLSCGNLMTCLFCRLITVIIARRRQKVNKKGRKTEILSIKSG